MEPVGATASAITLAELLKETIKFCVNYKRALKEAPATLAGFDNEVDTLDAILRSFNQIQNDPVLQPVLSDILQEPQTLGVPEKRLKKLQAQISGLDGLKSSRKRFIFPFRQNGMREGLETVERSVSLLVAALQLGSNTTIGKTHEEVALMKQEIILLNQQLRNLQHSGTLPSALGLTSNLNIQATNTSQATAYVNIQHPQWWSSNKTQRGSKTAICKQVGEQNLTLGRLVLVHSTSDTHLATDGSSLRSRSQSWSASFVSTCWFLQTIIRIRLEWTFRCNKLHAIQLNTEFIDLVPDDHPVMLSATSGNLEALKVALLAKDAPKASCATRLGWTPLHFAAAAGHDDVCRFLLQNGASVDRAGMQSVEPLHVAAHFGRLQVCRTLLSFGGDLHSVHDHGLNPLMELLVASRRTQLPGLDQFIDWLVRGQDHHLVDLEAQDNEGRSVLLYLSGMSAPQEMAGSSINGLDADEFDVDKFDFDEFDPDRANSAKCTQTGPSRYVHMPVMKRLIDLGTNLEARDMYGSTLLHVATRQGRTDILHLLLSSQCDIDARDAQDYTALHHAVMRGHCKMVRMLLEAGADVNAVASPTNHCLRTNSLLRYVTPVSANAAEGSVEIFDALRSYGACINGHDAQEVLRVAVLNDSRAVARRLLGQAGSKVQLSRILWNAKSAVMVDLLVSAGADPNGTITDSSQIDISRFDRRPLHWAAINGDSMLMQHLLGLGADVDVKDEEQRTALHRAVAMGAESSVMTLLYSGANPHLKDSHGVSPESLATTLGHGKLACLLRQWSYRDSKNKDESFYDEGESTRPVVGGGVIDGWHAACHNNDVAMTQRLIVQGADLNLPSCDERCPLDYAIGLRSWDVAELLVNAGANLRPRRQPASWNDSYEFAPLLNVAGLGTAPPHMVALMIQKGAKVNEEFSGHDTPLLRHLDLFWGTGTVQPVCLEVVKALLEAGSDVNAVDDLGRTPLGKAAQRGALEAVQLLVRAGAALDQPSSRNTYVLPGAKNVYAKGLRTPLAWAALNRHDDVVRFLYEAGANWKTLAKDPAITHVHGYLMESWFLGSIPRATPATETCSITPSLSSSIIGLEIEPVPSPRNTDYTTMIIPEPDYALVSNNATIHISESKDGADGRSLVDLLKPLSRVDYYWINKYYQGLHAFRFELLVYVALTILLFLQRMCQFLYGLNIAQLRGFVAVLLLGIVVGLYLYS